MSRPSAALTADLAAVPGDIMIVGVGGKMGPTVARMAKRACPDRRVIGIARFTEPGLETYLRRHGVETPQGRSPRPRRGRRAAAGRQRRLHGRPQVRLRRQRGRDLGDERAMCPRWSRSISPAPHRRLLDRSASIRSRRSPRAARPRTMPPDPPGEYAMSCVGRERMFQVFLAPPRPPGMLFRLNYAIDMRYGVLSRHRAQSAARRNARSRPWGTST